MRPSMPLPTAPAPQLGANIGVTVIIYEFSTPEDRQILVEEFQKGQNPGLVHALEKVKAVGRIQIPGTPSSV